MATVNAHVVIYGANLPGIMAARTLAGIYGLAVRLCNPNADQWGGVVTGGLSALDIGPYPSTPASYIGGFTRQFIKDVLSNQYSVDTSAPGDNITTGFILTTDHFKLEPFQIADEMNSARWRTYPGITSSAGNKITGITMEGGRIVSFDTDASNTFVADHFIDMSPEGDLMALAGVAHNIGREAADYYGEYPLAADTTGNAGYPARIGQYSGSPLDANGQRYYGVAPVPRDDLPENASYYSLMNMTFRLCLTQDATLKVAFTAPTGYSAARYEHIKNYLLDTPSKNKLVSTSSSDGVLVAYGPLYRADAKIKYDCNVNGPLSSNHFEPGYGRAAWQWAWVEPDAANYDTLAEYMTAVHAAREAMKQEQYRWTAGLLYFIATDASLSGEPVQTDALTWGYSSDEFAGTAAKASYGQTNFPHTLYIREARRMIGQYVMKYADVQSGATKTDPVAKFNYKLDQHAHQRYARLSDLATVETEGGVNGVVSPATPYEVPWRCLLPMRGVADNLASPYTLSSSHLAWGALRLDPLLMMLGEAAGHGVGQAMLANTDVTRIDYDSVRAALLENGAMLTLRPGDVGYED